MQRLFFQPAPPGAFVLACLVLLLLTACRSGEPSEDQVLERSWDEIEAAAAGESLTMMMWMGDPSINDYMNGYVVPELRDRYGIELEIVSGQGSQIVSTLLSELESGRQTSQLDLLWINGETFFQLRAIDALFGPFTKKLPHSAYVNYEDPFIGTDFQQPIEGMEAPWGNVQFTLIYDETEIASPPQDPAALADWVRANPGRFTIPNEFAGMTLLKSLMIAMAGPETLYGPFDEDVYARWSGELWSYLNALKPHFWRSGQTFPSSLAQLHQLFANGEVAFTMSNNDSEVDNKIAEGLFRETSRAYVPESGTIQNSHYLGIPRHAASKAAALMAINFLMSPEAQFEKMKPAVWGDGTILDLERLPAEWQQQFAEIPGRQRAPDRTAIEARALRELAPEYMIRLAEDFRREVME
ncbi:MAG: ABC transporter substrate-binding protein [Bacteroidetes bacterium]|jgi:putative spermidine/putrescine transport system substrate-binding protein|nr:ABC transporter substrate-binding protein [Bacteroidota bacterium]